MPSTPNGAVRFYADGIAPIFRSCTTEVFFLSLEAYPEPGSPEFGTTGGAFVHCYVDADDLATAERRAVDLLQEHGWRPHRLEGWEITSPAAALSTPDDGRSVSQLDLVTEALASEHAMTLYSWDLNAADPLEDVQFLSDRG